MVRKSTLKVLEQAINDGLCNDRLDFFTEDKSLTFEDYNGAFAHWGEHRKHQPTDIIPAGLFIYGEDNFIDEPDTVFQTAEIGLVAFYQLND